MVMAYEVYNKLVKRIESVDQMAALQTVKEVLIADYVETFYEGNKYRYAHIVESVSFQIIQMTNKILQISSFDDIATYLKDQELNHSNEGYLCYRYLIENLKFNRENVKRVLKKSEVNYEHTRKKAHVVSIALSNLLLTMYLLDYEEFIYSFYKRLQQISPKFKELHKCDWHIEWPEAEAHLTVNT